MPHLSAGDMTEVKRTVGIGPSHGHEDAFRSIFRQEGISRYDLRILCVYSSIGELRRPNTNLYLQIIVINWYSRCSQRVITDYGWIMNIEKVTFISPDLPYPTLVTHALFAEFGMPLIATIVRDVRV